MLEVDIIEMVHNGGTKDYVFVVLRDSDYDTSVILRRNGKLKTKGQIQKETTGTIGAQNHLLRKEINQKVKRDYVIQSDVTHLSYEEFHKAWRSDVIWAKPNSLISDRIKAFFADEISQISESHSKEPEVHVERGAEWGSW